MVSTLKASCNSKRENIYALKQQISSLNEQFDLCYKKTQKKEKKILSLNQRKEEILEESVIDFSSKLFETKENIEDCNSKKFQMETHFLKEKKALKLQEENLLTSLKSLESSLEEKNKQCRIYKNTIKQKLIHQREKMIELYREAKARKAIEEEIKGKPEEEREIEAFEEDIQESMQNSFIPQEYYQNKMVDKCV